MGLYTKGNAKAVESQPDCQAQGVRPKDFQRKFNGKAATLLKMAFGLVDDLFAAYPFLFLLDTSDPFNKALIFTIVLLPTAVLFAPFLLAGLLGWYIFSGLPMLIGKGATLILLGGYLISICFLGYTILRIYLPYVKLCLCDIRGPYKADRL